MTCYVLFTQNTKMGMVTVVPTEMWAFALPVWAYVLVGFCTMGFYSIPLVGITSNDKCPKHLQTAPHVEIANRRRRSIDIL